MLMRAAATVGKGQPAGSGSAGKSPCAECQAARGHCRNAKTQMTLPAWHEEPGSRKRGRKSFDCGDRELNDFLHRYARQSHDLGGEKTFLPIDNPDNKTILGFYSLAPGKLVYADTPQIFRLRQCTTRCSGVPSCAHCDACLHAGARPGRTAFRFRRTALPARPEILFLRS